MPNFHLLNRRMRLNLLFFIANVFRREELRVPEFRRRVKYIFFLKNKLVTLHNRILHIHYEEHIENDGNQLTFVRRINS